MKYQKSRNSDFNCENVGPALQGGGGGRERGGQGNLSKNSIKIDLM